MPVNFNLLAREGPTNFLEGLVQGQEQQNALLQKQQEQQNALFQQQQQRQLGNIQLRNALRAEEEALAESEAAKGSSSLEDLAKRQRQAGLGKQALATEAALGKQRADKLNAAKTQIELMKASAGQIMANPGSAVQVLTRFGQMTGMDMSDDIAQIQNMDTESIKNWAAGHAIDAEKLLPRFETKDLGGTVERQAFNPVTGARIGAPTIQQKTATPGELLTNARALEKHADELKHWDKLDANEKARLQETYRNNNLQDARARAQLAETVANNARVDRRKAEEFGLKQKEFGLKQEEFGLKKQEVANKQPGAQDQANALKALKTAGFNPETGEDEVSKLISKSTSGLFGAAADVTAGAFGKSTEGAKAIGQIETRLNQIALDLAGGKLGAGISNEDRKFIVSTLGDAANPLKPKETRLAAWNEAKQRMLSAGVISAPAAGGAASSVIDSLVDKYAPKGK
jgi:hypothetical protein